jgi:hypothetical protein
MGSENWEELKWFQSYLDGKRQVTIFGKETSEAEYNNLGVPQGAS